MLLTVVVALAKICGSAVLVMFATSVLNISVVVPASIVVDSRLISVVVVVFILGALVSFLITPLAFFVTFSTVAIVVAIVAKLVVDVVARLVVVLGAISSGARVVRRFIVTLLMLIGVGAMMAGMPAGGQICFAVSGAPRHASSTYARSEPRTRPVV